MKIYDVFKSIAMGFIITCVVLTFVRVSVVTGHSMDSTLYDKQKLIVSRTAYTFDKEPERGDIIVASSPKLEVEYIIKRIVGLPGETVEMRNNEIYINGQKLNEPYIKEPMINNEDNSWTLGENEYFICGDNRNNSLDSRVIGPIQKKQIFGKVVFDLDSFKLI